MRENAVGSDSLQQGSLIEHYRIVRALGQGGMANVFEAINERIEKHIAVKVLHPHLSQDPGLRRRFLNEARSVNMVRHPGIVDIYEFGETKDGLAYIVMEYLEGVPLHIYLQRAGRVAIFKALSLGQQIASALAAAHAKGIVHRDLKPANIIVVHDPAVTGGERTKVLDFGIAKLALSADADPGTRPGLILGTPQYMAPEQCREVHQVTDRADVYSLGIVLYQMLTGKLPFLGDPIRTMMKHISDEPPLLREVNPLIPKEVEGLVHKMLAKDPAARPSMAQIEAGIRKLIALVAESVVQLAGHPPLGAPAPDQAELAHASAEMLCPSIEVVAAPRGWRRALLPASLTLVACAALAATLPAVARRRGDQELRSSAPPSALDLAPVAADLTLPDLSPPPVVDAAVLSGSTARQPVPAEVRRVSYPPLRMLRRDLPRQEEMKNGDIELLIQEVKP